jgi:hypothetical protein
MFRIVVTTGPERGKVFEPEDELVHVGRGPDNQIVLDDASIDEHQASLLHKNGRYAIYRPEDADVLVDGSDIPAEKWVWLPTDARLQFGRRTSCQFSYEVPLDSGGNGVARRAAEERDGGARASEGSASTDTVDAPPPPARQEKKAKGERKRKKSAKRKRQTARFITDRGDTLVELGADGHLPELSLEDGPASRQKGERSKKSGPALLYCALGLSFLGSIGMLLIDPSPPTVSEMSRSRARAEIVHFFGNGDDALERWQESLRAARLAYSRRDYGTEMYEYRKVLNLLNSEDRDPHVGVTGHVNGDKELRTLIGIIISR